MLQPTLHHFHKLLFEASYPEWPWNTVPVSATATVASLAAAVLAACAIERRHFHGAKQVGLSIFLAYLVPPSILFNPLAAIILSWNEFIDALTFISSSEMKTVPVGVVTELVEGDVYHWRPLMAGALLGSLPVAFVYAFSSSTTFRA